MNKTEQAKGKALLAQIQDRYNKTASLLELAQEQHQVNGQLLMQLARLFEEQKKNEKE